MKKGMQGISALVMAGAFTLAMGIAGVSANEPGYGHEGGKDGYGRRRPWDDGKTWHGHDA